MNRSACKFTAPSLVIFACTLTAAMAADVMLVKNGKARAAIFVAADVMAPNKRVGQEWLQKTTEMNRRRLRESVNDLAFYMQQMSGAPIEIVKDEPGPKEKRLPIYVGELAVKLFGPGKKKCLGGQGWRLVVSRKGIGLIGESDLGASYAVYEVLDRLGCRWYMPSEMGACIPEMKTIELPQMDVSAIPATLARRCGGDAGYMRRNRCGGALLYAHHALERHITAEQYDKHPEWWAVINGKKCKGKLIWTRPEVANTMAENLIAKLGKSYRPSESLSPADSMARDQSEDPMHDPGDWDESAGTNSTTDRLMMLCNRVAENVTKEYPDLLFGLLAYQDYTRPPVREELHPNIIPQIAPILLNRAHPMTTKDHPNGEQLLEIVEGWGKVCKRMAHYWYGFNLAEVTAPNPMITKWSTDVPILLKNNCQFWMPEAMTCFETTFPCYYLGLRLAWYPDYGPKQIIAEMMQRFYGAASDPMNRYWHHIDSAWIDTREFVGGHWGYLRMFTPEVMGKARALIDEGLAACKTPMEYRRVQMVDHSLRLFELYMKMRHDLAEGRWNALQIDSDKWRAMHGTFQQLYRKQMCYTSHGMRYYNYYCRVAYEDAARVAREYRPIHGCHAMRDWKYRVDMEKKGVDQGWSKPDYDDSSWKTTDTAVETWSTLGHHNHFGHMWYRRHIKMGRIEVGKKYYLWCPGTDGSARLYINGEHVPYVNAKGEKKEHYASYATPGSFDVTGLLKPLQVNIVAFHCIRHGGGWINELGTGGIMGPVAIYRER